MYPSIRINLCARYRGPGRVSIGWKGLTTLGALVSEGGPGGACKFATLASSRANGRQHGPKANLPDMGRYSEQREIR